MNCVPIAAAGILNGCENAISTEFNIVVVVHALNVRMKSMTGLMAIVIVLSAAQTETQERERE